MTAKYTFLFLTPLSCNIHHRHTCMFKMPTPLSHILCAHLPLTLHRSPCNLKLQTFAAPSMTLHISFHLGLQHGMRYWISFRLSLSDTYSAVDAPPRSGADSRDSRLMYTARACPVCHACSFNLRHASFRAVHPV